MICNDTNEYYLKKILTYWFKLCNFLWFFLHKDKRLFWSRISDFKQKLLLFNNNI